MIGKGRIADTVQSKGMALTQKLDPLHQPAKELQRYLRFGKDAPGDHTPHFPGGRKKLSKEQRRFEDLQGLSGGAKKDRKKPCNIPEGEVWESYLEKKQKRGGKERERGT